MLLQQNFENKFVSIIMEKGGEVLNKLWCYVGGRV